MFSIRSRESVLRSSDGKARVPHMRRDLHRHRDLHRRKDLSDMRVRRGKGGVDGHAHGHVRDQEEVDHMDLGKVIGSTTPLRRTF